MGTGIRLHIVVSEELRARIDGARGDVPRSVFVRRAVERALGDVGTGGSLPASAAPPSSMSPAPAEQLGTPSEDAERALSEAEGSSYSMQAGPGPVSSSEGVRPAAPAEQPRRAGPDVLAFRRATQR